MWTLPRSRIKPTVPCIGRRILNHWATREVSHSLTFWQSSPAFQPSLEAPGHTHCLCTRWVITTNCPPLPAPSPPMKPQASPEQGRREKGEKGRKTNRVSAVLPRPAPRAQAGWLATIPPTLPCPCPRSLEASAMDPAGGCGSKKPYRFQCVSGS